jgi:hypothetical protein
MKQLILASIFSISLLACSGPEYGQPEPHLELGQRIYFQGGSADEVYLITGYRLQLEDKTESNWRDQNYIVFNYRNNQGDFKQGVIHRNAIQKR